jgi:hypothetical protein
MKMNDLLYSVRQVELGGKLGDDPKNKLVTGGGQVDAEDLVYSGSFKKYNSKGGMNLFRQEVSQKRQQYKSSTCAEFSGTLLDMCVGKAILKNESSEDFNRYIQSNEEVLNSMAIKFKRIVAYGQKTGQFVLDANGNLQDKDNRPILNVLTKGYFGGLGAIKWKHEIKDSNIGDSEYARRVVKHLKNIGVTDFQLNDSELAGSDYSRMPEKAAKQQAESKQQVLAKQAESKQAESKQAESKQAESKQQGVSANNHGLGQYKEVLTKVSALLHNYTKGLETNI